MSPISFGSLARTNPALERVFRELETWMNSHPKAELIRPSALAKDLPKIDAKSLAESLTLLERAGYLRRAYKVLTPSGVLADGEFEDPTAIPDRLPDRFEQYFDTSDADIIPVFHLVA